MRSGYFYISRIIKYPHTCYRGIIIMSKRKLSTSSHKASSDSENTKQYWFNALLKEMKNPEIIVIETKTLVVIKDKYPKAKIHYLVLPHDDIGSIFKLNSTHLELLEEFYKVYEDLKIKHKNETLRAGFHAIPSMQRLHMHIISQDFISPALKTKKHWNSFNTDHFIPFADLLKTLKDKGCINKMSSDEQKLLMNTPLQCNQCTFKPKNMPQLKEHLLSHVK